MTTSLQDRGDGVLVSAEIIGPEIHVLQRQDRREMRHERAERKHALAIEAADARAAIPLVPLVQRMAAFAMQAKQEDGTVPQMTEDEIRVAKILLDRRMPTLQAIALAEEGPDAGTRRGPALRLTVRDGSVVVYATPDSASE